jgi:hypothetical protein
LINHPESFIESFVVKFFELFKVGRLLIVHEFIGAVLYDLYKRLFFIKGFIGL